MRFLICRVTFQVLIGRAVLTRGAPADRERGAFAKFAEPHTGLESESRIRREENLRGKKPESACRQIHFFWARGK